MSPVPLSPHSSRPFHFKAGERGTQTNGVSMFNRSLFVRSHCGIFSDADHVDDVDDGAAAAVAFVVDFIVFDLKVSRDHFFEHSIFEMALCCTNLERTS